MPIQHSQTTVPPCQSPPKSPFKLCQPFINQVERYTSLTIMPGSTLRKLDRKARHVPLVGPGLSRRFFNNPAASVSRGKITAGANTRLIFSQNGLYAADSLDDVR